MKNSFKNLSGPELSAKLEEVSKKYFDLRFQMVVGHVENPMQKRSLRKQIARLRTLMRRNELVAEREVAAAAGKE